MDLLEKLFSLDLPSLVIGLFILMSAAMAIVDLVGKFSSLIGKPVRWVRKKDADHDLLMATIQGLNSLQSEHEDQIGALMEAQREALADRINQKYKYYISVKGIPEDEVDEFTNLHIAYKRLGGNHSGDAKYNYCMNHLPVIPVEVKLMFEEKKK